MNQKEIKNNLKSGKIQLILETLKYIASQGNKDILPDVIGLLHKTSDVTIKGAIVKILDNLKEQNCSSVLIDAIENPGYANELPVLISSCWKNSLNFEDYIEVFTNVFIENNFQIAFDALTVIDTFNKIDSKKADLCIIKLENSIEDSQQDKRPLFFELINIIKNIKENPA